MELHFTNLNQNTLAVNAGPVQYSNSSNTEEQLLLHLLRENQHYDNQFNAKFSAELFNFLQFTASMLLAFPVGLYMRKRIRKNKRLNYILQFKELLQVRNNIEKGSFAYDTLLFKQTPLQLFKNKRNYLTT